MSVMPRVYVAAMLFLFLVLQACAWVVGGVGIIGAWMQTYDAVTFTPAWGPYCWISGGIGFQGLAFVVSTHIMKVVSK